MTDLGDRWHRHFLEMARLNSTMSKDPATRVGSVVVNADRLILGTGFNGFPRGIADDQRLKDRDVKLNLVVHAEMNAIIAAARVGISVNGATMYTACTDSSGTVWGGPPCTRCAVHAIQAGIRRIIAYPGKTAPSRWRDDIAYAQGILFEAGIIFTEIPLPRVAEATS